MLYLSYCTYAVHAKDAKFNPWHLQLKQQCPNVLVQGPHRDPETNLEGHGVRFAPFYKTHVIFQPLFPYRLLSLSRSSILLSLSFAISFPFHHSACSDLLLLLSFLLHSPSLPLCVLSIPCTDLRVVSTRNLPSLSHFWFWLCFLGGLNEQVLEGWIWPKKP